MLSLRAVRLLNYTAGEQLTLAPTILAHKHRLRLKHAWFEVIEGVGGAVDAKVRLHSVGARAWSICVVAVGSHADSLACAVHFDFRAAQGVPRVIRSRPGSLTIFEIVQGVKPGRLIGNLTAIS